MENSSSVTLAGDFAVKKKRNLPGNPDPEAEVIALSPRTLLATNRFVCEVCKKGFQRDQNLQLHRRGHNLPWKLKQRGNKEVKKRVYICPEITCLHHDPSRALGDLTGVKKHFCRKHGEKKYKCERCSKKYAVHSDWKAHMKTCGTREYRCDCGTLFSRRDSFITHRAFCDALAQESARSHHHEQMEIIVNTEGNLKEAVTKAGTSFSSSSPPPQPLTPSTGVLSPVLSIQSSELPADNQNQSGVQLQQSQGGTTPTAQGTTCVATSFSSSKVFASVFQSSTAQTHPSSYPDICAIGTERNSMEPMSLSLSSSLYMPSNMSTLFQEQHYGPTTTLAPALSATALLQKAAQMGATTSNNSFLCGFGLAMSSPTDDIPPLRTNALGHVVKLENNVVEVPGLGPSGFTDLMMGPSSSSMMFGNKPATLDFLGLGDDIGANGSSSNGFSAYGNSSNGFSAFLSSMESGFGQVGSTTGEPWEDDHCERKPSML